MPSIGYKSAGLSAPPAVSNDRIGSEMLAALSQTSLAFAICDHRCRPTFVNATFGRLMDLSPAYSWPEHLYQLLADRDALGPIAGELARANSWAGTISIATGIGSSARQVYAFVSRFHMAPRRPGYLIQAGEQPAAQMLPAPLSDEEKILDCPNLTPRERQVMLGLMRGGTNKSIAIELGVSGRTIEFHRARMMNRFKVKSLMELRSAVLALGELPR